MVNDSRRRTSCETKFPKFLKGLAADFFECTEKNGGHTIPNASILIKNWKSLINFLGPFRNATCLQLCDKKIFRLSSFHFEITSNTQTLYLANKYLWTSNRYSASTCVYLCSTCVRSTYISVKFTPSVQDIFPLCMLNLKIHLMQDVMSHKW